MTRRPEEKTMRDLFARQVIPGLGKTKPAKLPSEEDRRQNPLEYLQTNSLMRKKQSFVQKEQLIVRPRVVFWKITEGQFMTQTNIAAVRVVIITLLKSEDV